MKNTNSQLLAECLQDLRSGKYTLEECLSRNPALRDDLLLIQIALMVQPPHVAASDDFKIRTRQVLYLEMGKFSPGLFYGMGRFFAHLRPVHSLRMLTLAVPLAVAVIFSGVLYASRGSLPDGSLYGLKTGLENFNLAVTRDPIKKADLRLALLERRVDEIIALNQLGRPVDTNTLNNYSTYLDLALYQPGANGVTADAAWLDHFATTSLAQKKKLAEVIKTEGAEDSEALKQVFEVTCRGVDVAVLAKSNPGVLQLRVPLTASEIDTNHFTLVGKLLKMDGDKWNIGGIILQNVDIAASENAAVGDTFELKGVLLKDTVFITSISPVEIAAGQVVLDGTFLHTEQNDQVWDISGIEITVPPGRVIPDPGRELEIRGLTNADTDEIEWEEHVDSAGEEDRDDEYRGSDSGDGDSDDDSGGLRDRDAEPWFSPAKVASSLDLSTFLADDREDTNEDTEDDGDRDDSDTRVVTNQTNQDSVSDQDSDHESLDGRSEFEGSDNSDNEEDDDSDSSDHDDDDDDDDDDRDDNEEEDD